MAYKLFKPHAGRYGVLPKFVWGPCTTTANTTVNTLIATPKRKCYIERAAITAKTVGSDADGTILCKLQVVAADGTTARDITSTATSLEAAGVTALVPTELTITATKGNRYLHEGETLRIEVVNDSAAIDTAPVAYLAVELLVQQ
jgi:hypothetical protein